MSEDTQEKKFKWPAKQVGYTFIGAGVGSLFGPIGLAVGGVAGYLISQLEEYAPVDKNEDVDEEGEKNGPGEPEPEPEQE